MRVQPALDNERQPIVQDRYLFVAPLVERREPREWSELGRLLLVIEDGDARVIERWRPGDERPEVLGDRIEWRGDPAQEPLTIDFPALFGRAAPGTDAPGA